MVKIIIIEPLSAKNLPYPQKHEMMTQETPVLRIRMCYIFGPYNTYEYVTHVLHIRTNM